ncbi:MAG: glycosyltransferase family 4 protein [Candidatus Omnitrophica bacterium]|nr:glycosyltransferase family 4 protein [Candidatus Omnitrophota bacterium]
MIQGIGNNKNIVISTHDSLYPIKGGGALRTLKVAYELRGRGYNLRIIAPTEGASELNGIKLLSLYPPTKQHSQILSTIKFNIRLLVKFLRFVRKTDIFLIHNTIAAIFLPFLKKIFKFRFILDLTDIHAEYLFFGQRNLFEKLLTPYLLRYEYFIIKSADYITVATKAMKNLLILKGIDNGKIEVVYDGIDRENIFQEKDEGAEHGVIHLGAMDRQHGVEVIIRAIPYVTKEFPRVNFFFVGGGREFINIKKLAQKLGVINNCVFTDWLPCEEAREFLKKACIGIIPRKDNLPNRIITTLKIYEYWASKTAVISSLLEGIKEIASGNKDILWFEPGNERDLARKIIFLLIHKEFKDKLIKGGLTTVNNFDMEKSASRIVDSALFILN